MAGKSDNYPYKFEFVRNYFDLKLTHVEDRFKGLSVVSPSLDSIHTSKWEEVGDKIHYNSMFVSDINEDLEGCTDFELCINIIIKHINKNNLKQIYTGSIDEINASILQKLVNKTQSLAKSRLTEKQVAEMLDRRQYGSELTEEEEKLLRDSGLVVVFGYSDDNVEFRGAIHDDAGVYKGGDVWFTKNGLVDIYKNEALDKYSKQEEYFACITANWHGDHEFDSDDTPFSWSYSTDLQHSTFDIYNDKDLYCQGIVFSVDQLSDRTGKGGVLVCIVAENIVGRDIILHHRFGFKYSKDDVKKVLLEKRSDYSDGKIRYFEVDE